MEVVLSPGNLGGESSDGSPFRDEDVHEWSRVDRVTGMLERARVETDRWRINTHDAAHSYGKMTDSRQRNSADGSLVQKARRQVEIFQSQGNGGRSFQVVRASQWSSSRATDSVFDIPITKPSAGGGCTSEMLPGDEASPTPRLGLWRASLERGSSDLERLSCLCRELHDEAIRTSGLWSSGGATPREELGTLVERRSNSSEDVTSQPPTRELFARDCRTRRSLQIAQSPDEGRSRRPRNELVAERARTFEEGATRVDTVSPRRRGNLLGSRTFASIADNDFVKNDPKHPSKVNHLFAKISLQDVGQQNNQGLYVGSEHNMNEQRKANNKTVVHLRNAASPVQDNEDEPPRCINLTAIKLDNDSEPRAESVLTLASSEDPVPFASKPVKKVEFCKTEIHFAADCGKVNIVETDGKPPPTNKFRRRRRNNHLGTNNMQKNNMPLVHFGDTFYEKYIFGGQGKILQDDKNTIISNDNPIIEDSNKNYNSNETEIKTERWHSSDKIRENGVISNNDVCTAKDSYADMNPEKIADHNNKYRGTHTTTVNFVSDESSTVPKVNEGVSGHRIQLQFASSNKNLSPITSDDDDENDGVVVTRTTKITLRLPAVISQHSRILQCNPFSNLKSVRLVMSIGQMMGARDVHPDGSVSLKRFFSSLCNGEPRDGLSLGDTGRNSESSPHLWSLRLKSDDSRAKDQLDKDRILDRLRIITDKSDGAFPTKNKVVYKDVDPVSEKISNKNQVVSKDPEKNQVLLKIVTSHKPTVARVENDHTINHLKSRLKSQDADAQEKSAAKNLIKENGKDNSQNAPCTNLETKDYCDNSNGINEMVSNCIEAPTYENIFDAVSDGVPLYENFQIINSNPLKVKSIVNGKPTMSKRSSNAQSERPTNNLYDGRHKKISSKINTVPNNERTTEKLNRTKPDRIKSTRSVTPISSLSSTKSDKNSQHFIDNLERTNKISSRLSNSRDDSSKKYKDTKLIKENGTSGVQVKRKVSSKIDPGKQEYKGAVLSNNTENNTGRTRSKKPVEVVYQTVVFNMKNEKLSKPTKTKEAKGPRLINDLICGSKMRRPSDSKRIIKAATVSQNTSKRKEIPSTMNRQ